MSNIEAPSKFLGLLIDIPKSKKQVFAFLKERNENKTTEWVEKLLSKGGKETLLKVVASTILAFTILKLLSSLYKSINSIMTRFCWGENANDNKNY